MRLHWFMEWNTWKEESLFATSTSTSSSSRSSSTRSQCLVARELFAVVGLKKTAIQSSKPLEKVDTVIHARGIQFIKCWEWMLKKKENEREKKTHSTAQHTAKKWNALVSLWIKKKTHYSLVRSTALNRLIELWWWGNVELINRNRRNMK